MPKRGRRRASGAEWAWAAGLFEGEGTILNSPSNQGRQRRLRLQLKMTDEDVVRHFAGVVGGSVYGPYHYDQPDGHIRKPHWLWNSDTADPAEIIRRFEPWLGKRRRARIAYLNVMGQGTLPWGDPAD